MLLGSDTGFLIGLANRKKACLDIWSTIRKKENNLAISVISLNELLVYYYKRGKSEKAKRLIRLSKRLENVHLIPVTVEIAEASAGYRHGLGMPTIDSLILATFVLKGCTQVYTTDSHFDAAKKQKVIEVIKV